MSAEERTRAAVAAGFSLSSSSFQPDEPISARHTCDGADLSPALSWNRVPNGTQSWALIVDDPDAPNGVFTPLLLFNLSAGTEALPEGVAKTERPDFGGRQGQN